MISIQPYFWFPTQVYSYQVLVWNKGAMEGFHRMESPEGSSKDGISLFFGNIIHWGKFNRYKLCEDVTLAVIA